ncbi:Gfo/Idh/MocA family protein [Prosthecomicrobium pneumaticum]|uniref:Putative dehydrogenase n=1 Tax=Prosthecomicrobium pneumaticum TaxID=81895 RepID=A0A7W9L250_9HYPH|nr:Gfo/Idh/MocA family oxidoreductase [Prosthecomicrobium pneumaticum]MBB5753234.1 putative dehydrogenase [Prosthecomicrobium pneumaticum]
MRVLILGSGSMAEQHARSFMAEEGVLLAAAVEPNAERRAVFGAMFEIPKLFASLDEALAWGEFDACANVTPDAVHHPTTMALLAAGKHVFCEKPLATSYPLAIEMAEAAEKRGVINMVNFTYRNSPALQRAHALVEAGAIGEVRHFDAAYLQSWLVGKHWGDWRTESRWLWRLSEKHGSKGVLGDVGVHIVDFASFAMASDIVGVESRLRTFAKAPGDKIGDYTLDVNDSVVMTAELANGALGTISATRYATGHANDLVLNIYGTEGALEVRTTAREWSLRICAGADIDTQTWQEVPLEPVATTYQRFVAAVKSGENGVPSFRRAAEIQRILDLCFAQDEARRLAAAAPAATA